MVGANVGAARARAAWLAVGIAALAGCRMAEEPRAAADMAGPTAGADTAAALPKEPGLALWDGRASLGGVWIAHPDVTEPRPVVLRRVDTGGTVGGMIYRRGDDPPGPPFQISAAAAHALGIEAGTPRVVAVTEPADAGG